MCPAHRIKFEAHDLEPIEDELLYDTRAATMVAYWSIVAEPDYDLGSVYVTEDDGSDHQTVIAGHYC